MSDQQSMKIQRPEPLSNLAAERIRDLIIRGEFDLGASLSEAGLSKALGISKTPIREALAALRLQGLVDLIPQRGAFVFSLGPEEVTQLCSYRTILESHALDLALKLNPESLFSDLARICEDMAPALRDDDFDRYLKLDADFHEAFFVHCGNTFLHEGYGSVSDVIATLRTHLSRAPDRTRKSFDEHTGIYQLARDGKVAKAKTILKKQITRGERVYSELNRNGTPLSANPTSRD